MGCICSKGTRANQYVAENNSKNKELTKKSSKRLSSLKRENVAVVVEPDGAGDEANTRLILNDSADDDVGSSDDGEGEKQTQQELQKKGKTEVGTAGAPAVQPWLNRISSLGNGEKGAQVVAGWPSWLAAVAGEAINGWVPRKANSFEKLDMVS